MNERWFGLARWWTDVDDEGKPVSSGQEALPVVVCAKCGAVVAESHAEPHDRWHARDT